MTSRDSFAMRLATESKPHEAMPMNGRPPASARSSLRSGAATRARTASAGSPGMPSTRAKSLPRPPGSTPSGVPVSAKRAGHGADEPVAAEGEHGLAGLGGGAGQLHRVVEAGGLLAVHRNTEPPELGLGRRQLLGRATGAGGGIDDEGDGAVHAEDGGRLASKQCRQRPSASR